MIDNRRRTGSAEASVSDPADSGLTAAIEKV